MYDLEANFTDCLGVKRGLAHFFIVKISENTKWVRESKLKKLFKIK
ncbi:7041_t:CDS:2 [Funneliformis mosseae]|uniref:7041_t:CDS:1 n=1 Tax=Funneliformis mosseae TaxID=27381 RepID=A0A9N8V7R6_FUNMO|nr:7041_t:CDS:2 [Funneliformis mosseae]